MYPNRTSWTCPWSISLLTARHLSVIMLYEITKDFPFPFQSNIDCNYIWTLSWDYIWHLVQCFPFFWDKKSPRGIIPRRCSLCPQGTKYIAITQDVSPCGEAEVCNQYLFGWVKTGVLGQVTTNIKQEKPQGHWTLQFFPLPSGCKIHYGYSRYEPKWCKFFKLVIYSYVTIDMFAALCPPPPNVFSEPFSLW